MSSTDIQGKQIVAPPWIDERATMRWGRVLDCDMDGTIQVFALGTVAM